MRNLNFHLVRGENVLCFGPQGVEIHFKDYGNVVQVRGVNLDMPGTENNPASNASGKCFGIDTLIMMFDGSTKKVQDVRVGDLVMGPDSQPRKVLTTASGREPLYKVSPTKGDHYIVNESHILTLKSASKKHRRFVNHPSRCGNIFNITVREYLQETKTFKQMMKGYRAAIEFPAKDVLLDPYILGVWLGDGTSTKPEITNCEPEVVAAWHDFANNNNLEVNRHGEISYALFSTENSGKNCCHNWFSTCWKLYNLRNNKHVPKQYKINSKEVRLKVLAGLIDTDGSKNHAGYDFINKNKRLADDVVFLARSVGLAAYCKPCTKKCQNDFVGQYWRVFISGNCSIIPVRVGRKKCERGNQEKDVLVVGISIEPIGEGEYYGFSVDQDHLFLLGDFTVVHNSSLQELLSIALFGRTVKSPTKNKGGQIINVLADKGVAEAQWDDYRVLRTFRRAKSGSISCKLEVWKSANKIWDKTSYLDRGTADLQAEIDRAIGMSHHSFCNVVIFDDSNTYSFLEADTPVKREIVENLLDLEQYREYHKNAKDFLKELKAKKESQLREYTRLLEDVETNDKRLLSLAGQEENWFGAKRAEIARIRDRIESKQAMLESTDSGEQLASWQKSQDRISELSVEIEDLEHKKSRVSEAIVSAREKVEAARLERSALNEVIQQHSLAIKEANGDLQKAIKLAGSLQDMKDGTACPYCYGTINRANYGHTLISARHTADECRSKSTKQLSAMEAEKDKYGKKTSAIVTMEGKIREAEGKIAVLEGKIRSNRAEIKQLTGIPKPEGNVSERVLEAEIIELRNQVKTWQAEIDGGSPYKEIVTQALADKSAKEAERDAKVSELQVTEDEIPYYEFWTEAFGDNGIRKFVIDGIIPSLNERVAYWMQILCDGIIELEFDNMLDATITRNGNVVAYHMTSNGERRRINLAVSQAFAYVMMLNSGTCPSLVFLDEITGGGIDKAGIPGVHNMIFELAKERQVFVTTHNDNLMGLLEGCETITLKKQNDITVLAS